MSIDKPVHSFAELFIQLGLDADDESISGFLETHAPLAGDVRLADAKFLVDNYDNHRRVAGTAVAPAAMPRLPDLAQLLSLQGGELF